MNKRRPTPSGEEWRDFSVGVTGTPDPVAEAEALARARVGIERHRKDDLTLRLVGRDGRPLAGFPVDVVQTAHAFPFGDQLWELDRRHRLGQWETDRAFYWRERFAEVFNAANALCYWTEHPRNDGPKTEDVQGRNVTEHFAACVDWAAAQGLQVKGHPLFWSIPKCIPEWLKRYGLATQMTFAEVRVRSLVARFRGKIHRWDAVNEALWEATLTNLSRRHWPHLEDIGDIAEMVGEVLRWCKEEDPEGCFLVNDYGLEEDPAGGAPVARDGQVATAALQRQRYLALLAELKRRGLAPDAVGLQSHSGSGWVGLARQTAVFDELAEAGLPLHVTEFWAHTDHLEKQGMPREERERRQADYVCNLLSCAFGHPAVEAFFFWGFMDDAIAWDEFSGHRPQPLFMAVRDLIRREWQTLAHGTTDGDGQFRFRGFHGDYALRFRDGNLPRGIAFTLAKRPPSAYPAESILTLVLPS